MEKDKTIKLFDYDKETGFSFYVPLKNEDANPYVDDELLVVCDGLGGSGAYTHKVEFNNIDSLDKIKNIVIPELEESDIMDEYLAELFEPLYSNDEAKTSALWASRIVISRFVYCWKVLNIHNINEIKDFIFKGLYNVKKQLELTVDDNGNYSLLPTTFIAVNVSNNSNGVKCKALWAGDSRAYCYLKNGLKPITKDDEDTNSELINNLFFVGFEDRIVINEKDYEFNEPCILFVCSDGIFDNRSQLVVENVFAQALENASTMEEFKTNIVEYYDKTKQDDCTVALKAYGFSDFASMKSYYLNQITKVKSLLSDQDKYGLQYYIKKNPSDYTDSIDKVISRTKDRVKMVCENLANSYVNNNDDIMLTDSIKESIGTQKKQKIESLLLAQANKKQELLKKIKELLLENMNYSLFRVFNNKNLIEKAQSVQKKILDKRKEAQSNNQNFISVFNELIEDIKELTNSIKTSDIFDLAYYNKECNKLNELVTTYKGIVSSFKNNQMYLQKSNYKYYYPVYNKIGTDKFFSSEMYTSWINNYNEQIDQLFSNNVDIIIKGLDRKCCYEDIRELVNEIYDINDLKMSFTQNEIIDIIYHHLDTQDKIEEYVILRGDKYLKGYQYGKSVIDNIYNPNLLNKFFKYHEYINYSDEDFLKFVQNYEKYQNDSIKYIDE